MDFRTVTNTLIKALEDAHISYALIGGFAVSLWGYQRATVDMDFLVNGKDVAKLRNIVEGLGYRCIHATENVTQFEASDRHLGKLDFLHACRPASLAMLEHASQKAIFDGEQTIPVVLPEDLIGLKVQAIHNDPTRTPFDMTDIEALMRIFGSSLDWGRIEEYFKLFDMNAIGAALRCKYDIT